MPIRRALTVASIAVAVFGGAAAAATPAFAATQPAPAVHVHATHSDDGITNGTCTYYHNAQCG